MKLKKFTAVSLTVAMTVTALTGCGSEEKEKDSGKSSGKEVSAESFSDALEKGSKIENYDYKADIKVSVKGDELFAGAGEEIDGVLDTLGISSDEISLTLSMDGSVKGTDAQKMTLGFEMGSLSGDITDIVYAEDTLYVNVAKAVDMVEQVADKFGMKDEISTYVTLLPEGDYISVSKDTLTEVYDSILLSSGISAAEIESTDTEALTQAVYYLMDEVEKAAKNAEGVYSSKDGYSISVNQDNVLSFIGAGISVFAEDGDEIIRNLETITGDLGVSAEDAMNSMGIGSEEDMNKVMEELESSREEIPDFDFNMITDYSGTEGAAVWTFGYEMKFNAEGIDMTMSVNTEITENSDVKVKVPESVMDQEDVEALLSMMGINSVDDIMGTLDEGTETPYNMEDDFDYDDTL